MHPFSVLSIPSSDTMHTAHRQWRRLLSPRPSSAVSHKGSQLHSHSPVLLASQSARTTPNPTPCQSLPRVRMGQETPPRWLSHAGLDTNPGHPHSDILGPTRHPSYMHRKKGTSLLLLHGQLSCAYLNPPQVQTRRRDQRVRRLPMSRTYPPVLLRERSVWNGGQQSQRSIS